MAARKDENIHQSAKENTTDITNYLNMDSIDDKPVPYLAKERKETFDALMTKAKASGSWLQCDHDRENRTY